MEDIYQESLTLHEKYKGKLEVRSKIPIKSRRDLTLTYTPGVAQVCREIVKDQSNVYKYTIKSNTVAIVTDGSAVLGLGNIGGYAAIPVMEGKAILFKEFAGIDAFPICFKDYHIDFTEDVKNIAPVFGAINLEDIAAPKCFQLEEDLQDIGIPVMHDDQHGTAVVVLAGLINACKVVKKELEDLKIVLNGAGAAGYAITRFLGSLKMKDSENQCPKDILVCDRKGIIHKEREDLKENKYKQILANETNCENQSGSLTDALKGSDVFIGISGPNLVSEDMVRSMNENPIIFGLANPDPEIMPDLAKAAGASVVATGRSDFPNQINNVLAFPGIFRGALDAKAKQITHDMKSAAVYALANYIEKPKADYILPDVLDRNVTKSVASAVADSVVN
jgi:malate dehydrogenase (oxaloacetate-decarboxylating)